MFQLICFRETLAGQANVLKRDKCGTLAGCGILAATYTYIFPFSFLVSVLLSAQIRSRDAKMYELVNNVCAHFFLARVKSVPNFTLFCCNNELCCNNKNRKTCY